MLDQAPFNELQGCKAKFGLRTLHNNQRKAQQTKEAAEDQSVLSFSKHAGFSFASK